MQLKAEDGQFNAAHHAMAPPDFQEPLAEEGGKEDAALLVMPMLDKVLDCSGAKRWHVRRAAGMATCATEIWPGDPIPAQASRVAAPVTMAGMPPSEATTPCTMARLRRAPSSRAEPACPAQPAGPPPSTACPSAPAAAAGR